MNQKVAGALPADLVAQYADDVTVAKAQVQNTMRAGGSELFQSWIVRAEMALQAAKASASNATRTEQRTPGTYDPIDIERRHLTADLAQLRLDRGKSLLNASPDAKLQWVVDMVDDELARLKKRTAVGPGPRSVGSLVGQNLRVRGGSHLWKCMESGWIGRRPATQIPATIPGID